MNVDNNQEQVIEYAKKYGFTAQDTGGNCTALKLHVTEDIYFMITDDAEIPEDIFHPATFGIYIGDRIIFFVDMETKYLIYMGQKIYKVLKDNLFNDKLNFDIAEISSWLEKNNYMKFIDSWSQLKTAYEESTLLKLAIPINTTEELNVAQVALDHYVEFLEDVYTDKSLFSEIPEAEQKLRINVAKGLVERLKEITK